MPKYYSLAYVLALGLGVCAWFHWLVASVCILFILTALWSARLSVENEYKHNSQRNVERLYEELQRIPPNAAKAFSKKLRREFCDAMAYHLRYWPNDKSSTIWRCNDLYQAILNDW